MNGLKTRPLLRDMLRSAGGMLRAVATIGLGLLVVGNAFAQAPATGTAKASASTSSRKATVAGPAIEIEPKALAILKAASERLAGAKTLSFTAYVSEESPSRLGPALLYTTRYDVTLQRPNKLRVISPGDGPANELYYDGKTISAYAPAENMLAVAPAPGTIDAALLEAFKSADIYYPFTDLIVVDPYRVVDEGLRVAFYVGQAKTTGGTTTDIVAFANDDLFVQLWIGAEDKLPRKVRAVYRGDRKQLRHEMEMGNWQLDAPVADDAFVPPAAAQSAMKIAFAKPEAQAHAKPVPKPLAR